MNNIIVHGLKCVAPNLYINNIKLILYPIFTPGAAGGGPLNYKFRSSNNLFITNPGFKDPYSLNSEFLEWFVGVCLAESNFNIRLTDLPDNTYKSAQFTFQICLHKDEINVLEYIKNTLNVDIPFLRIGVGQREGNFNLRLTNLSFPFRRISIRHYSTSNDTPYEFVPVKKYANADTEKLKILQDNKKKAGVYRWTNLTNNKSYIGSGTNLSKRLRDYYSLRNLERQIKNNKSMIYRSIIKYGFSSFTLEILEYCSASLSISREQYYLDFLKPEYNILKKAGSSLGRKHSDEAKAKMREKALTSERLERLKIHNSNPELKAHLKRLHANPEIKAWKRL